MLTIRLILVNPRFCLFLALLALVSASCGFQLNRNRVTLLDGAQSIALEGIENHSYAPRLDVDLAQSLTEALSRAGIPLSPVAGADLTFRFVIDDSGISRNQQILGTIVRYDYRSFIRGRIWLTDQRNKRQVFVGEVVEGFYLRETTLGVLSETETRDDLNIALGELTRKLTDKLSLSF